MIPPSPAIRLLLDTWREVCRHLDIHESARLLAPRLAEVLPLRRVVVRRLDVGRARIDTVATGDVGGPAGVPPDPRTPLAPDELERLGAWARAGQVRVWRRDERDALRDVLSTGTDALVAVPLLFGEGATGLLVVEGGDELAAEAPLVQALAEPFSVALANDARLQELARLREAVEADNRALLARLQRQDISDSVVGAETGLREVMERVEQVARTDAPVLIFGETGSGKEVVARSIHARSRRAEGPFLRVNCGAIPPELVDSELFGHERGSFTGAVATRRGWFERADGGTLFLDELGELPPAAQVRLLRVLQDGTFERVGGQRVLTVDVRIVAATHRDMRALVSTGAFREDLWYRVSVFPIHLPPLRDRRQDIAPLANHFAARAGQRLHGVPLVPTSEDTRALEAYEWPGNVRELAAVIERAAILGDGRRLDVKTSLGVLPPPARPVLVPPAAPPGTLDATARETITEALRRTRGRIEGPFGAARILGINPHTLRSRMRKLGIAWDRFRAEGAG
jgi:transcriptional regulator with GAF, ATPase, and Fis domain